MADKPDDTKAAEAAKAKHKQDADTAAKAASEAASQATEEAREQDAETNKQQADLRPYPSQEEADQIRAAAAGVTYLTRDAQAK